MRQSVISLENFYCSALGQTAQAMSVRRLHALWPHLEGKDVLGYGYAVPYLRGYEKSAHRIVYAMPSAQGASRHMSRRGNASVLTEDEHLPFAPASFDRILLVHGIEEAPRIPELLTELWRLMMPEGRIVIIAANRAGLWARSDKTPFGAGRPFSRSQLSRALKDAGFMPVVRSGALYCPPIKMLARRRISSGVEVFGETVWPGFSGLVLVEAVKRLYARRKGHVEKRVLRPNFTGAIGTAGKTYRSEEWTESYEKK